MSPIWCNEQYESLRMVFKYLPTKYNEGGKSNFTMEKPGRRFLQQS